MTTRNRSLGKRAQQGIRELFAKSLDAAKLDPVKNLAAILADEKTPVEVQASINLALLRLLVPPAKPEEKQRDNGLQILIQDFSNGADGLPKSSSRGVPVIETEATRV